MNADSTNRPLSDRSHGGRTGAVATQEDAWLPLEFQAAAQSLAREADMLSRRYPAPVPGKPAADNFSRATRSWTSVWWLRGVTAAACLLAFAGIFALALQWKASPEQFDVARRQLLVDGDRKAERTIRFASKDGGGRLDARLSFASSSDVWEAARLSSPELEGLLDLMENSNSEIQRVGF